jgi:hypothetical protein
LLRVIESRCRSPLYSDDLNLVVVIAVVVVQRFVVRSLWLHGMRVRFEEAVDEFVVIVVVVVIIIVDSCTSWQPEVVAHRRGSIVAALRRRPWAPRRVASKEAPDHLWSESGGVFTHLTLQYVPQLPGDGGGGPTARSTVLVVAATTYTTPTILLVIVAAILRQYGKPICASHEQPGQCQPVRILLGKKILLLLLRRCRRRRRRKRIVVLACAGGCRHRRWSTPRRFVSERSLGAPVLQESRLIKVFVVRF